MAPASSMAATVGTRVSRRVALAWRVVVGLAAAAQCQAWCTDDEKGPCTFNIRSKAADNLVRSVQFWDAGDKLSAAIEHVPHEHDLRVTLGNGAGKQSQHQEVRLHLTQQGFLAVGAKNPTHQIDATNMDGTSALRLEGRTPPGKGGEGLSAAHAAVRLGDAASHQCANLYYNGQGHFWGLSFSQSGKDIDASDGQAVLQISARAPAQSMQIDNTGRLALTQVGAAANSYPRLHFRRARGGAPNVPQIILKDDTVGELGFDGYDGSRWAPIASVAAIVQGPVMANQVTGRLEARIKTTTKVTLSETALDLANDVNLTLGRNGHLVMQGGSLHLAQKGSLLVEGDHQVLGKTILRSGLAVASGNLELSGGNLELSGPGSLSIQEGSLLLENGDMSTRGSLRASAGVETAGALNVGGNADLGADLRVQGAASVGQGGLDVQGDASLAGGALAIEASSGATTLQGSLRVLSRSKDNAASLEIVAEDKTFVLVDAKTRSATVDGSMAVAGNTLFGDNVGIEGDLLLGKTSKLNVPGSLAVGAETSMAGNVIITSPTESTSTSTGGLVVQGGLGVDRSITVGDAIAFGTDGAAAISAISSMSQGKDEALVTLEIQGDVSVLDDLRLEGNLRVGSALTIDAGSSARFTTNVVVNETLSVARNLDARGDMTIHANLTVDHDAVILGNLSVNELTSLSALAVSGAADLHGPAHVHGGLNVTGAASFAAGTLRIGENLLQWDKTVLQLGTLCTLRTESAQEGNTTVVEAAQALHLISLHGSLSLDDEVALEEKKSGARLKLENGALTLHARVKDADTVIATVNETHASWPLQGVALESGELKGLQGLQLGATSVRVWADADTDAVLFGNRTLAISNNEVLSDVPLRVGAGVHITGKLTTAVQTVEAGGDLDESVVASFVQVVGKLSTLRLPLGAASGEWLILQNSIDEGDLVVATPQGTSGDATFALAHSMVSTFVFDGATWRAPSAPEVSGASLRNVRALTAESDLHVGEAIEFAAGRLRAESLAEGAAGDPNLGKTQPGQTAQASDEPLVADELRMVATTRNGTLAASNALVLHAQDEGDSQLSSTCVRAQCVSSLNMTGPIEMNGNRLANVTIEGGALHGISELHVGLGGVHVSGGVAEASDARLKESIQPLDGDEALRQVRQLRGVSYHAKAAASGHRELGFLAQEVEQVVPEVVSGKDVLAVQYSRLVPLLVESIKRLEERVSVLEEQLARAQASV